MMEMPVHNSPWRDLVADMFFPSTGEYNKHLRKIRAAKHIVRRLRAYHWSQWRRIKQRR